MDKIVIQVKREKGLIENFLRKIFLISAINSCSNMLCPAYKICSEQSTGPVCKCAGNKVGAFCQYGKLKSNSRIIISSICYSR
jgi:hypothetical protein